MKSPTIQSPILISRLAEEAERICAAWDFVAVATATLRAIVNLFQCSDVIFCAFDLPTLRPIIHQQSKSSRKGHSAPKLEKSRNLVASLDSGAEVVTIADQVKGEYYVIYENTLNYEPPELRIPFFVQPHTLCLLSLGKKDSGTDYKLEEIDALRVLICLVSRSCAGLGSIITKVETLDSTRAELMTGSSVSKAFRRCESFSQISGQSPIIQRVRRLISQIAPTDASVLITGESGTGKELVARAIHQESKRLEKPMVIVNCAALPDSLVESELFGHEKGAFTGAIASKKGKFEFADGSTLFLDEIGDLSLAVQAKLLRVLQDCTFQRVGGNTTLHGDVRLIAATNKDLLEAIQDGTFREDLFYRINVVQIEMPPLRERREDITLLVEYYFDFYNHLYQKSLAKIDPQLLDWMMEYAFPGNIRELKNIVERVVIMENDPCVMNAIISQRLVFPATNTSSTGMRLDDLEKEHIRIALQQTQNNKSAAARRLGIARKTLREKIVKYQL